MNICVVSPSYPSENNPITNIFIKNQVTELAKRGHHITVIGGNTITRNDGDVEVISRPGILKIIYYTLKTAWQLPGEVWYLLKNNKLRSVFGKLSMVQQVLNLENTDVIDGNYANYGGYVAYLASRIKPVRYVVSCQGVDIEEGSPLIKRVLDNAACIITPSEYLSRKTAKHTEKYYKDIITVPNAIYFQSLIKYPVYNNILSIGFLNRFKNHKDLLYAFYNVRFTHPEYSLIIIGNGDEEMPLRVLRERLNLTGHVHLYDFSEQQLLNLYYATCKFFVLPTLQESFGLVFAEAMSFGKPVIGTNVGGVPETVGDGGIIVEPNNVEQLTEAMLKLIEDEELYEQLSNNALKQSKKFNVKDRIDKIEQIYRQAIE